MAGRAVGSFVVLLPQAAEIRELSPTPVPTATAIISVWMGKAKDTAVSALSPTRATKILSTMLYIAWMSMENMAGSDIETISGKIGGGAHFVLFCIFHRVVPPAG